VILPVSNPDHCKAVFTVPYFRAGNPFRGGNALIGPGAWKANSITGLSPAANICARHQFSLNTCGGCHHDDTGTNDPTTTPTSSTNFTHIDPLSPIPVRLSKFLTGNGPGVSFDVDDTQLGAALRWKFGDLEIRYRNLFNVAFCTMCSKVTFFVPEFVEFIGKLGPVPVDPPDPEITLPFTPGPIIKLSLVEQILQARAQFAAGTRLERFDRIGEVEGFTD